MGASPHRRESSMLWVFIIVSFLDHFEVKNKQTNKQKTKHNRNEYNDTFLVSPAIGLSFKRFYERVYMQKLFPKYLTLS